ncbi:unnamed protein product, partial [Coccothraustes coccothraustes]
VTEARAVSPLAPAAPGEEEGKEEQIEVDDRQAPSVASPEPGSPEPVTEARAVSPLAPAAPGEEEGKEEQIEVDDRQAPSVASAEPGSPEP